VKRHAGIDEAEQEQHDLHGNTPPALELCEGVVRLRRRFHE